MSGGNCSINDALEGTKCNGEDYLNQEFFSCGLVKATTPYTMFIDTNRDQNYGFEEFKDELDSKGVGRSVSISGVTQSESSLLADDLCKLNGDTYASCELVSDSGDWIDNIFTLKKILNISEQDSSQDNYFKVDNFQHPGETNEEYLVRLKNDINYESWQDIYRLTSTFRNTDNDLISYKTSLEYGSFEDLQGVASYKCGCSNGYSGPWCSAGGNSFTPNDIESLEIKSCSAHCHDNDMEINTSKINDSCIIYNNGFTETDYNCNSCCTGQPITDATIEATCSGDSWDQCHWAVASLPGSSAGRQISDIVVPPLPDGSPSPISLPAADGLCSSVEPISRISDSIPGLTIINNCPVKKCSDGLDNSSRQCLEPTSQFIKDNKVCPGNLCTVSGCCEPKHSCQDFNHCPSDRSIISDPENHYCEGEICTGSDTDIDSCCQKNAPCSTFSCDSSQGYRDKHGDHYCTGLSCENDLDHPNYILDRNICCEPITDCDINPLPSGSPILMSLNNQQFTDDHIEKDETVSFYCPSEYIANKEDASCTLDQEGIGNPINPPTNSEFCTRRTCGDISCDSESGFFKKTKDDQGSNIQSSHVCGTESQCYNYCCTDLCSDIKSDPKITKHDCDYHQTWNDSNTAVNDKQEGCCRELDDCSTATPNCGDNEYFNRSKHYDSTETNPSGSLHQDNACCETMHSKCDDQGHSFTCPTGYGAIINKLCGGNEDKACDVDYCCEKYKCDCPHGTPAEDCTSPNEHKCINCIFGYNLNSSTNTCDQNICVCSNGDPTIGPPCPMNGQESCVSCDDTGYTLNNGICESIDCVCANGTPLLHSDKCSPDPTSPSPPNKCISCDDGYVLDGGHCHPIENYFTCKDGQISKQKIDEYIANNDGIKEKIESALAVDPKDPGDPDWLAKINLCSKCNSGFHLDNEACSINNCECDNGYPATGPDCPDNGDNKCIYCHDGYHLDDTTNTCIKNHCHCDNGYTVADKNCTHDGENMCKSCYPGFRLEGNNCVKNKCTCKNGEEGDQITCLNNGSENCKEDLCDPGFTYLDLGNQKLCLDDNQFKIADNCKAENGRRFDPNSGAFDADGKHIGECICMEGYKVLAKDLDSGHCTAICLDHEEVNSNNVDDETKYSESECQCKPGYKRKKDWNKHGDDDYRKDRSNDCVPKECRCPGMHGLASTYEDNKKCINEDHISCESCTTKQQYMDIHSQHETDKFPGYGSILIKPISDGDEYFLPNLDKLIKGQDNYDYIEYINNIWNKFVEIQTINTTDYKEKGERKNPTPEDVMDQVSSFCLNITDCNDSLSNSKHVGCKGPDHWHARSIDEETCTYSSNDQIQDRSKPGCKVVPPPGSFESFFQYSAPSFDISKGAAWEPLKTGYNLDKQFFSGAKWKENNSPLLWTKGIYDMQPSGEGAQIWNSPVIIDNETEKCVHLCDIGAGNGDNIDDELLKTPGSKLEERIKRMSPKPPNCYPCAQNIVNWNDKPFDEGPNDTYGIFAGWPFVIKLNGQDVQMWNDVDGQRKSDYKVMCEGEGGRYTACQDDNDLPVKKNCQWDGIDPFHLNDYGYCASRVNSQYSGYDKVDDQKAMSGPWGISTGYRPCLEFKKGIIFDTCKTYAPELPNKYPGSDVTYGRLFRHSEEGCQIDFHELSGKGPNEEKEKIINYCPHLFKSYQNTFGISNNVGESWPADLPLDLAQTDHYDTSNEGEYHGFKTMADKQAGRREAIPNSNKYWFGSSDWNCWSANETCAASETVRSSPDL